MRFKRFTFSLRSPLFGFHIGENPVSGQRFVHVAPFPFFGIDFNLPPYNLNDEARAKLQVEDIPIENVNPIQDAEIMIDEDLVTLVLDHDKGRSVFVLLYKPTTRIVPRDTASWGSFLDLARDVRINAEL